MTFFGYPLPRSHSFRRLSLHESTFSVGYLRLLTIDWFHNLHQNEVETKLVYQQPFLWSINLPVVYFVYPYSGPVQCLVLGRGLENSSGQFSWVPPLNRRTLLAIRQSYKQSLGKKKSRTWPVRNYKLLKNCWILQFPQEGENKASAGRIK